MNGTKRRKREGERMAKDEEESSERAEYQHAW